MFTRVLVPLDDTPAGETVMPTARALARATGATIIVVRVLSVWNYQRDDPEVLGARAALIRIAEDLATDGLRSEVAVISAIARVDDLPTAIVAEARARGADLILMMTHGRGGLSRLILGSTAEGVVAQSSIPVMLQRPSSRHVTRIDTLLLPVDGTLGGRVALDTARDLARRTSARIIVLQVVIPDSRPDQATSGEAAAEDASRHADWGDTSHADAQQFVANLAARLAEMGVAAEGRVARGPVAKTIVEQADDTVADLIVMSTHARTGPQRAILGSVADAVVRTANVPVLLVRQTG
jgi:nucleotide-binding universal stress UspA family protein